jgi:hypothetical protein
MDPQQQCKALLKMASQLLEEFISLASGETTLVNQYESIQQKLLNVISAISQLSVEQNTLINTLRGNETKYIDCIQNLKAGLVKQDCEIHRLRSIHQKDLCDSGMNTDSYQNEVNFSIFRFIVLC